MTINTLTAEYYWKIRAARSKLLVMQQLINHPQVHFKIQVALPVSYLLDIGDIVEISQAILTKPRFGLVMTQCKSPLYINQHGSKFFLILLLLW